MSERRKARQWVVQAPEALRSILRRMGEREEAVRDGRVFVDRQRCRSAEANLIAGSVVDVFPPGDGGAGKPLVLSRRGPLIAVAKPPGLSTIPDQRGNEASLRDAVARLVGERDAARVHPTSRLDRDVSGVVVFALDRAARQAMREARDAGRYRRHYVALACRAPSPAEGWVDAAIGRGRRPTERCVGGRDAVPARTRYATVAVVQGVAMVAVEPDTGRTHQIRVHLSHVGAPLLGDDRYGGGHRVVLASGAVVRPGRIALHAAWVRVQLDRGEAWRVDAPVGDDLAELWRRIGGSEEDWTRALAPIADALPSTAAPERGRVDDGDGG